LLSSDTYNHHHHSNSLLFFFYSHAAHRHLHSFPTRRSSDLPHKVEGIGASFVPKNFDRSVCDGVIMVTDPNAFGMGSVTMITPRSEEHTSELQSRGHLVCRLLLEKKKKK